MKLTKTQYKPIARKPAKISNYEFMCAMLYIVENGCKWRALSKKYGNWHTIYMKFSRWSKNVMITKILEAMKKQKLINEEDDIFFIDSTSINVSPDANRNKKNQKQNIGRSKGGLTTKLHLCCTSSCPAVFRLSPGNSHDALKARKLIEVIYFKNNKYFLIDRACKDDKTLALAKSHGFFTIVPPKKKIVSCLGVIIDSFINIAIISNDIF
ncbi:MAG: IS5 family transposase [Firmicutes bacterium]|nr:IS5 family transposase [Bacillota bacterium]